MAKPPFRSIALCVDASAGIILFLSRFAQTAGPWGPGALGCLGSSWALAADVQLGGISYRSHVGLVVAKVAIAPIARRNLHEEFIFHVRAPMRVARHRIAAKNNK